jgi:hypothetical protein
MLFCFLLNCQLRKVVAVMLNLFQHLLKQIPKQVRNDVLSF